MELTILMPCLNEAETIGICIGRARKLLDDNHINGEILVSDNGSTDGSTHIAEKLGAIVTHCPLRGYGAALQHGIEQASGVYILMGDSDDSYHFDEAFEMVSKLREGADVCMGTRLRGTIAPGAMPLLNRYLGNPVLTRIGRFLFGISMSDFHCGMRGFRKDAILRMELATSGMEWASEMVIKSWLGGLSFAEVPITLHRDGRSRPPHLRRWRDGWRHLRFMLLHAPTWLFVYPGLFLVLIATFLGTMILRGPVRLGSANLDVHSLLTMSFLLILGVQTIFAGLFANLYGHIIGILPTSTPFIKRLKRFSLEKLLVIAVITGVAGFAIFLDTFLGWSSSGYPELDYRITMRRVIPALTLMAISSQAIVNGFMFSMLFLKTKSVHCRNLNESLE
jgi:glycosyltransferase involved in cell wall biosynthesis